VEDEALHGGVNQVIRRGETVIRPTAAHSPTVHRLLRHLETAGFQGAPRFISIDPSANTETLSFLVGETSDYPLSASFRSDRAVVSAARLLRQLHDAAASFEHDEHDTWWLAPRQPAETIVHGDFAPYNCVITNGEVTGVFDFDTAHPAPRLWDVGYAAYRWAPLTARLNRDGFGSMAEQVRRLQLFCSAYGTDNVVGVLQQAHDRLLVMVQDMRTWAAAGNEAFQRHLVEGHDETYLRDVAHLAELEESLGKF
jgi:aminoglycoside phosphotransferase (APT) family kinase protein